MGYHPRGYSPDKVIPKVVSVEERIRELNQVRENLKTSWATAEQLTRNDQKKPRYEKGSLVWLEGINIRSQQPSAKLSPKRYGPFKIEDVLGPVTYKLHLPPTWKIHPVFHESLITPYKETEEHGPNYSPENPTIVGDSEEYEVDQILNIRKRRNKYQYLVKWKEYTEAENT